MGVHLRVQLLGVWHCNPSFFFALQNNHYRDAKNSELGEPVRAIFPQSVLIIGHVYVSVSVIKMMKMVAVTMVMMKLMSIMMMIK